MSTNGVGAVFAERDVVFGRGGARDLKCDIYRPHDDEKRTALIQLHGGAFRVGSKEQVEDKCLYFANRGYLCIASEYRLAHEAKWPSTIHDVKACIRWVRSNADQLGIDPDRIGVVGYSAGALLSLMAAGTQNRLEFEGDGGNHGAGTQIAVCLAYYPPVEITRRPDGAEHWLFTEGSRVHEYRKASPLRYVSPDWPPTVLFHGTADQTVSLEASVRMFHALRAEKVPVELHALEGLSHEFDRFGEFGENCAAFGDLFLDRHVINPRVYPTFQPSPYPSMA